jgi:hypothetical protein
LITIDLIDATPERIAALEKPYPPRAKKQYPPKLASFSECPGDGLNSKDLYFNIIVSDKG